MNLFERIVRADEYRKTRLHDQKGHRVDLAGLVYAPHSLVTTVLRFIGYRPLIPWMPYRAARALNRIITREMRVLEFGSGGSTVWLARRAGSVHSIEHEIAWYEQMSDQLRKHRLTNVTYELRDPDLRD